MKERSKKKDVHLLNILLKIKILLLSYKVLNKLIYFNYSVVIDSVINKFPITLSNYNACTTKNGQML